MTKQIRATQLKASRRRLLRRPRRLPLQLAAGRWEGTNATRGGA
jgi:hypothetical protein